MFTRRVLPLLKFLCAVSLVLPSIHIASVSRVVAHRDDPTETHVWSPPASDEGFVYYQNENEAVCRPATREEALAMSERDPSLELRPIRRDNARLMAAGDISIVLRGTTQLDEFPEARQGFLKATERWEALIQAHTSITIIIDVDFGPTRFGTPFGTNTLGSTGTQALGNSNAFGGVRAALVARADGAQETALYNALPPNPAPTDLGTTSGMVVPSALLRALGEIPPVANPAAEAGFGSPPAIGFNSNFAFDFDPSNGIDTDKIDFDSVATHEIGHALGFSSRVGDVETNPTAPITLSVFDAFRLRPGATLSTFTTAQRILSSGGSQVFYAGAGEVEVSTGRANGTGGDGFQASHWKNGPPGLTLGIMDPAIAFGERQTIAANDLAAFDTFGYLVRDITGAPLVNSLSANLVGDVLTLTGRAGDQQGDIAQAETALLDGNGALVQLNSPVAANLGGQVPVDFNLSVFGLNNLPAATRARLVLIDTQGHRSAPVVADFSAGDPGGPSIILAFYDPKLIIKGRNLIGVIQIEVNGLNVGSKDNGSNKKLKIGGSAESLNIRSGLNRVRVINGNLRSNLFVGNLQ